MTITSPTPPPPPEHQQLLDAAALAERALTILDQGWIRGTYSTPDGVCSVGAVNRARYQLARALNPDIHTVGFTPLTAEAIHRTGYAGNLLKERLDTYAQQHNCSGVIHYNDSSEDVSRVIEMFKTVHDELVTEADKLEKETGQ